MQNNITDRSLDKFTTDAPKRRVTLDRAAQLADRAIEHGRARRLPDGRFRPGNDMRARLNRHGVRSVCELTEADAADLDRWITR